jgi:very-short-patch-repair endonuclease
MELYLIIGLIILVLLLVSRISSHRSHTRKVFKNNTYSYIAKQSLMTRAENEFFLKLERAVSERYYVFPQVHLSSLLDHHVEGQDWGYAFRHINGKSVDYVLCSRETLRPTYAIELDDYSHDQSDRRRRDKEVERIFDEANLSLVRFKNKNISEKEIILALMHAQNLLTS